MKLWIPIAFAAVIVLAYVLFFVMSEFETQGASSFGMANTVGLLVVFVGVIAAGVLLRRASPP